MNHQKLLTCSAATLAVLLGTARLSADVVDIKNGAHIVGKVTKIDEGLVVVDTDYAGTLKIKQSEVTAIATDAPIAVRLKTGTRIDGKVSSTAGTVQVVGADGSISTTVDKIAASWEAGAKDPAIVALERGWAYEASVDVDGKTGNKNQLATAAGLRATLKGPSDVLMFYTNYNRQVTDGAKSADQFKAGVDYQSNFSGKNSWYVRDEGGFDRIKDIRFYDVAAAGVGYDLIKQPKETLTARIGLAFRSESYGNPATPSLNAPGLDVAINHSLTLSYMTLTNRLAYDPDFNDFQNYRFVHESYFELPLANPAWKIRIGVENDYNSKPGAGIKRLDTSYFTRFVLDWK